MLTDAKCRNAKCPDDKKRARLTDSGGLYLEITPSGSRRWFYKYRAQGVEKRLALGSYPAISLSDARVAMQQAKATKATGADPVIARRKEVERARLGGNTFAEIAAAMVQNKQDGWSDKHTERTLSILKRDLIPYLGSRQIADIEAFELLATLKRIEDAGAFAKLEKARAACSLVWSFAVQTGKTKSNILPDMRGAFKTKAAKHFPTMLDPKQIAGLLKSIEAYHGGVIVKAALRLAPMLFQRPNELRGMAWNELDLDAALWTIPSMRMKRTKEGKQNGDPHLVPLSTQAVKILRDLQPYTGKGTMVFPSERDHAKPMSENTLRVALLSMGFSNEVQTVHGFRAMARTLLTEVLDVDPLVIEQQLAHSVKDALGRSYNRTTYIKQRTAMMQKWGDYLQKLTADNVVILKTKAA